MYNPNGKPHVSSFYSAKNILDQCEWLPQESVDIFCLFLNQVRTHGYAKIGDFMILHVDRVGGLIDWLDRVLRRLGNFSTM